LEIREKEKFWDRTIDGFSEEIIPIELAKQDPEIKYNDPKSW
jgi:transcription initiation factor TFIID subunit TAF12